MIDMQGGMELALGNGARSHLFKINIELPKLILQMDFITGSNINTLCKATTIPGCKITQRAFHTTGGHTINIPSNKVYDTECTVVFYLDDFYSIRVLMEKWVALLDSYNGQQPSDINTQSSILGGLATKAINFDFNSLKEKSDSVDPTNTFNIPSPINKFLGEVSDVVTYVKKGLPTFKNSDNSNSYLGSVIITQMSITGAEIISYKLNNAYPIMLSIINFNDTSIDSINEFTCSFGFTDYEILKTPESFASEAFGVAKDISSKIISGTSSYIKGLIP
jgi:hypothetical protein